MESRNFYIEFYVTDPDRLRALERFFEALKSAKGSDYRVPDSHDFPNNFLQLLDDGAKTWFSTSESEEGWDFESMIYCLFEGEYSFTEILRRSDTEAVLYYDPWAGPFGGTESIKTLIEAFGHQIMYDSWNDGQP